MPTSPEATTAPEKEAEAPKFYNFDDALSETGRPLKSIIRSKVSSTPPKMSYGEAGEQVAAGMEKFTAFGSRLIEASRIRNMREPVDIAGRDIDSLGRADAALPGVKEYMLLVRRKLDGFTTGGPGDFDSTALELDDNELAFSEAMEWAALREQRLAMPQEITPDDYSSDLFNPHGAPFDTYENAREHALQQLELAAQQRRTTAQAENNVADETDADRVLADLQTYRDTYMTVPPVESLDRHAARVVGEQLNSGTPGTPGAAELAAMDTQTKLDRVFATYDSQIKGLMKNQLDAMDQQVLGNLQNQVTEAQNTLAGQGARKMRRMKLGRDGNLEGQADYDNASAFLGAMELRMAQRLGIPNPDGTLEKLPRSGAQVDAFVIANHLDRAKKLDAKIIRELDENRTFGDQAADFWAGRHNGEKEKRKTVNFARRLLKVSVFATSVGLFGPAGVAAGAGLLKGSGKLARYTSDHADELRKRDMSDITDIRDLQAIMDEKNVPAIYKIFGTRREERGSRSGDLISQHNRVMIGYGKATLWAAGVGLAPVYAAPVAHIGLGIAENSWELAKWSGSQF